MNVAGIGPRLEGEPNFRDAAIPGFLEPGRVFRSGELSQLSAQDVEALSGLRHVVDLRTARERSEAPDRLPAGVEVLALPIDPRGSEGRRVFLRLALRRQDFDGFMHQHYQRSLFEHSAQVGEVFRVLARAEGPVLVHCTAGKDRTGVVIALLQGLLGASEDQVLENYLETNGRMDERARSLGRRLRWMGGWPFSAGELEPLMQARASYLQRALERLRELYGDESRYLAEACGVDRACQADLLRRLGSVAG